VRPADVAMDAGSSTSAAMTFHISTGHEQKSYSAQVCMSKVRILVQVSADTYVNGDESFWQRSMLCPQ